MLEAYLRALHRIHATGGATDETSYYPPLERLLEAAGEDLSPTVQCVMNPSGHGAGLPDGAFFTAGQIQEDVADEDLLEGQTPARGVMEVKGPSEAVLDVADTEQVSRYFERYGQVLVTNYREFLLIVTGEDGEQALLTDVEGIDAGEAVLFAETQRFDDFRLLTGDKNSLRALVEAPGLDATKTRLAGRIFCFEQLMLRFIDVPGFETVCRLVEPVRSCDGVLDMAFDDGVQTTQERATRYLEKRTPDDLRVAPERLLAE